jgi:hypothetical protein
MNINLAPANGIVRTKVLANPARAKQAAEKLDFSKSAKNRSHQNAPGTTRAS